MFVKYIGKADSLTTDFNGKRYCFSKSNPIVEIPEAVYTSILKSGHFNAGDIVPYQPSESETVIDIKAMQELKKENDTLRKENKKLSDELDELKKTNDNGKANEKKPAKDNKKK